MHRVSSRRSFLKSTLTGLVCATGALSGIACAETAPAREGLRPPNVVLIVADDLGAGDVSCYGPSPVRTPNIDRLAKSGVRFTAAYGAAPLCTPSRVALLTGLAPARLGMTDLPEPQVTGRPLVTPDVPRALSVDATTLPELLKSSGYVSSLIGKWHVSDSPETGPIAHGFDVNIGGSSLPLPASYVSPYGLKLPDGSGLPDGPAGEYLTDRLTDETIKTLRNVDRNRPFFVMLSHYAIHKPIQGRPDDVQRLRQDRPDASQASIEYESMLKALDDSVGQVTDELRALGLADNTVIIFTSDNGSAEGVAPIDALSRGSKGELYDGGLRVPLIIHLPGAPGGRTSDEPVIGMDVAPTLVELTGAEPAGFDGESLLPILRHTDTTRRATLKRDAIYWHFPHYQRRGKAGVPAGAVRAGDWKLIERFEDNSLELYDLKTDPQEQTNRAPDKPDLARSLHEKLLAWRAQVGAKMPVPSKTP